MQPNDLTIAILRGIREDVQGLRDDVHGLRDEARLTNDRLGKLGDATHARLDRLERRQTETDGRLATELVPLASAVREIREAVQHDFTLRDRIEDHERRILAIERRSD